MTHTYTIMHIVVDIDKLKERARAAGLPLRAIARRAGVAPGMISRMGQAKGGGSVRTLVKLNLALMEMERERARHLAALHPADEGAAT